MKFEDYGMQAPPPVVVSQLVPSVIWTSIIAMYTLKSIYIHCSRSIPSSRSKFFLLPLSLIAITTIVGNKMIPQIFWIPLLLPCVDTIESDWRIILISEWFICLVCPYLISKIHPIFCFFTFQNVYVSLIDTPFPWICYHHHHHHHYHL